MNAPPPPSRVPRGVRNCGDIWEYRAVPIVDVWRALLDRLPPEAPGLFNRGLLMVLLGMRQNSDDNLVGATGVW